MSAGRSTPDIGGPLQVVVGDLLPVLAHLSAAEASATYRIARLQDIEGRCKRVAASATGARAELLERLEARFQRARLDPDVLPRGRGARRRPQRLRPLCHMRRNTNYKYVCVCVPGARSHFGSSPGRLRACYGCDAAMHGSTRWCTATAMQPCSAVGLELRRWGMHDASLTAAGTHLSAAAMPARSRPSRPVGKYIRYQDLARAVTLAASAVRAISGGERHRALRRHGLANKAQHDQPLGQIDVLHEHALWKEAARHHRPCAVAAEGSRGGW